MKNHFLPCFYTKRWALEDRKLTRFTRPARMLIDRKRYPSQVGYEIDLYTLPGIQDETKDVLEKDFFKNIDQKASDVLNKIERDYDSLYTQDKQAWVSFLISLRQRNRESMKRIANRADVVFEKNTNEFRHQYDKKELAQSGISFDQFVSKIRADGWFERTNKLLIQGAILLPRTTNALMSFCWHVFEFNSPQHELITSDRPLIMTNGLAQIEGHIALPIGPRKLFVAARDLATLNKLRSIKDLNKVSNDILVRQARDEVYATSCDQSDFIKRRFRLTNN